jgi:DNA-3-methyladenine glycosylase
MLSRSFYCRPTLTVARELLGCYFVRRFGKERLVGKIVEVEAYGHADPASHSFRGRTKRNEVMFRQAGHLYVYFTYGMHFCANVVTGPEGVGEAVLIRAVEPVAGIDRMLLNRYKSFDAAKSNIAQSKISVSNGPAKFCQAFAIGRAENGIDLVNGDIGITEGETVPRSTIGRSSRVGIREGLDKQWRFFIKGNVWVSKSGKQKAVNCRK